MGLKHTVVTLISTPAQSIASQYNCCAINCMEFERFSFCGHCQKCGNSVMFILMWDAGLLHLISFFVSPYMRVA